MRNLLFGKSNWGRRGCNEHLAIGFGGVGVGARGEGRLLSIHPWPVGVFRDAGKGAGAGGKAPDHRTGFKSSTDLNVAHPEF